MIKLQVAGPFNQVFLTKPALVMLLLVGMIIAQSLGVIYIKQSKRLLHAKLQSAYAVRDSLQVEWSKLLLEQSTYQSEARVERIARERLGMVTPEKTNVITP